MIVRHGLIGLRYESEVHIAPGFVTLTFQLRKHVSVYVLCLLSHFGDSHGSKSTLFGVSFLRGLLFMAWGFHQTREPLCFPLAIRLCGKA